MASSTFICIFKAQVQRCSKLYMTLNFISRYSLDVWTDECNKASNILLWLFRLRVFLINTCCHFLISRKTMTVALIVSLFSIVDMGLQRIYLALLRSHVKAVFRVSKPESPGVAESRTERYCQNSTPGFRHSALPAASGHPERRTANSKSEKHLCFSCVCLLLSDRGAADHVHQVLAIDTLAQRTS